MKNKPYLFRYSLIASTFGDGWGFNYEVVDARRVAVHKEKTFAWWRFVIPLWCGFSIFQSVRPKEPSTKQGSKPSATRLDPNELTEDEELPQSFWDKQRANIRREKRNEAASK